MQMNFLLRFCFCFTTIFSFSACVSLKKSLEYFAKKDFCSRLEKSFYYSQTFHKPIPPNFTDIRSESFEDYCLNHILDDQKPGNPALLGEETPWSLSQSSGLMLAVHDQHLLPQPYMKTVLYKTVGSCQLGMQIFIEDLNQLTVKNLKPFLFIHGGAWQYRRLTSTVGIETIIPHLTSRNYVVFSPFYRLLSSREGPEGCGNVKGSEIEQDIKDAFLWVQNHYFEYGVKKLDQISVGGQSAGGHLATFLITEYPQEIDKALLLYPATDFPFMIQQIQSGAYKHLADSDIFAKYTTQEKPIPLMDISDPALKRQSFPKIIKNHPEKYPAVYMIHGASDLTCPLENSLRLCEAYEETSQLSESIQTFSTSQKIYCGKKNKGALWIIEKADHMLDLRCFDEELTGVLPSQIMSRLSCPAGGVPSSKIAKKAIEDLLKAF